MMDIPKDIDRIATDLVRKSYADSECSEWDAYKDIAAAILAERKRCAEVARRSAPATQDFADAPLQELALYIAAKIEAGT